MRKYALLSLLVFAVQAPRGAVMPKEDGMAVQLACTMDPPIFSSDIEK